MSPDDLNKLVEDMQSNEIRSSEGPVDLCSEDWNLISRTIVPVIDLDGIAPGQSSVSGFEDIVQPLFISTKAPTSGGLKHAGRNSFTALVMRAPQMSGYKIPGETPAHGLTQTT